MSTTVVSRQGDIFAVVDVTHARRMDGQSVRHSEAITVPIMFNTLQEAEDWCGEVKPKGCDHLIFGCWNPALKDAGGGAARERSEAS